ncbi:hypothetical protein, partial [Pseudomonas aeruginosa]
HSRCRRPAALRRRRWPENAAQMLGTPQVDRRLRLLERSRRDAEEAAHD